MSTTGSALDVEHQLVFYASYHSNPTNVRIHQVFVPLILWSWQGVLSLLPPIASTQLPLGLQLDWALLWSIAYQVYYFLLAPLPALLYLPQMIFQLALASHVAHSPSTAPHAALIFWSVFFTSWIVQFYGHGKHERRAPALLDNLVQALVLAPFFVHLESLFAFGYDPELHRKIKNGAAREISKLREKEGKTRAGRKKTS